MTPKIIVTPLLRTANSMVYQTDIDIPHMNLVIYGGVKEKSLEDYYRHIDILRSRCKELNLRLRFDFTKCEEEKHELCNKAKSARIGG